MAVSHHHCYLILCIFNLLGFLSFVAASLSDFSIINYDDSGGSASRAVDDLFHGDYSPPPPLPPSPPPHPPSLTCEDLHGIGSLRTTCELNFSLNFTGDVYVEGKGNVYILPGVVLKCPNLGCSIVVNISGEFRLSSNAEIIFGSVFIVAQNVSLLGGSVINVTELAGEPPERTTGTPKDAQGGGGGHGGRGASCIMDNKKLAEDVWGGDTYSWSTLDEPFSFGSKGGTTNKEADYGGLGGGRIWLEANDTIDARGLLLADGGDGGIKGGGGSGGSVYIKSQKM